MYILPSAAGDVTDLGGCVSERCYKDGFAEACRQMHLRINRDTNKHTNTHRDKEVNNSLFLELE